MLASLVLEALQDLKVKMELQDQLGRKVPEELQVKLEQQETSEPQERPVLLVKTVALETLVSLEPPALKVLRVKQVRSAVQVLLALLVMTGTLVRLETKDPTDKLVQLVAQEAVVQMGAQEPVV